MLLVASALLMVGNLVLLTRVRGFAWDRFFQVGKWSLLAYLVIAGLIEFAFLENHVKGGTLVVLTLSLVVFAIHVPALVGFTVARYVPSRRATPARTARSASAAHSCAGPGSADGLESARQAPVAQLDRASVYGTEGREFESLRARLREGSRCPAVPATDRLPKGPAEKRPCCASARWPIRSGRWRPEGIMPATSRKRISHARHAGPTSK